MIEYSFDITARKHTETAIKESETKFRSVAQSAKDAIITADKDGIIVFCNAAAQKLFGYSEDELVGKFVSILMPERFREAHERGMARVSATGQSNLIDGTIELFGLTHKAREFPVELSLSSWKSGDDIFYTGIIRDISERKQHEKERDGLIDRLQKSLNKVRKLSGLLPICASCKKIRDDKGYWNQIEGYIRDHSEAEFSHGICPECSKKLYPEYHRALLKKTEKSKKN
jgi:PAS domain S-box-containing protein